MPTPTELDEAVSIAWSRYGIAHGSTMREERRAELTKAIENRATASLQAELDEAVELVRAMDKDKIHNAPLNARGAAFLARLDKEGK